MLTLAFILLHYLIGLGIIRRLRFSGTRWEQWGLAYPLGLGAATVLIFVLEVAGISLARWSVSSAFVAAAGLLMVPDLSRSTQGLRRIPAVGREVLSYLRRKTAVEWFFFLLISAFFLISAWRCSFFPISTYDAVHGIDLLARSAVAEGRIHSRMFSDLAGHLSTQPYYAPFTAFSQIIYLLAGHLVGTVWLSFMFLSLLLLIYTNLRRYLHPGWAGFLVLLLISTRELYAYTFLLQTDFANAVFVSAGVIYLHRFIEGRESVYFYVAALLWGLATWTRSETVAFSAASAVLLFIFLRFSSLPYRRALLRCSLFLGVSFIFFAAWNLYYLPVELHYAPQSVFKWGFWDGQRLLTLFTGMTNIFLASPYWGYLPHLFLMVAVINLLFFKDRGNIFLLCWMVLLFLSFAVLLYHLQLGIDRNIDYTFRRGTFKFWPVAVYYMGSSAFLRWLSPPADSSPA